MKTESRDSRGLRSGPTFLPGKAGWILLWLVGIPVPVLLILYFIRGCT